MPVLFSVANRWNVNTENCSLLTVLKKHTKKHSFVCCRLCCAQSCEPLSTFGSITCVLNWYRRVLNVWLRLASSWPYAADRTLKSNYYLIKFLKVLLILFVYRKLRDQCKEQQNMDLRIVVKSADEASASRLVISTQYSTVYFYTDRDGGLCILFYFYHVSCVYKTDWAKSTN